mgnify:CR=1 FL=1
METIRIITEAIASFFFILNMYLLLANRKLKIIHLLIDKSTIFSIISFIFSLISLIIGINNYAQADILMSIICIINFISILYTIIESSKQKKVEYVNIIYNKNNIRELTKEEKKKYKELLVPNDNIIIKVNGKEKLLICECSLHNIENGDILKTEKRYIDSDEYYLCTTIIKNESPKKDYINFIMNIYVIVVATYGFIIASNNFLIGQITKDNESIFITGPILYGILSLLLGNDNKNKLKGFTLFLLLFSIKSFLNLSICFCTIYYYWLFYSLLSILITK